MRRCIGLYKATRIYQIESPCIGLYRVLKDSHRRQVPHMIYSTSRYLFPTNPLFCHLVGIRNASILDVLSPSMHSSYIQKAREKHGFQMRGRKQREGRKGMKDLQGWRCRLLYKVMTDSLQLMRNPFLCQKHLILPKPKTLLSPIHPVWPAGDSSMQYYNNYAHTINPYYGGINRLSGNLPHLANY